MMNVDKFEFNPFGENTYIIWDQTTLEAIVIDPGMSSENENKQFDRFIQAKNLSLKAILLTHIHIDHTFGVDHLKTKYDIPVLANQADEFLGQRRMEQAAMFHLPFQLSPLSIDRLIEEGEVMRLNNNTIYALHAPGHSPGSLLYYIPTAEILFSGDVLFQGSIGRTDLPGGNYGQLIASINTKIAELPPTTRVYPGHGPATTIAEELRSNPYF